ncbi:glycine betaine/L-proline ABC transporter ATP-binding protein [Peptoniphilus sp. KCTC 25270]|uniref:quaternary amine ABC transporter ATP-binding protein n=1 Tax=Peptoniphilus sp. KCTC 25270 TaxID=2897414 RepID=UPI001E48F7D8|nr:glycine betaine/L-proline ABC transporter ATP-binding protein [Peptoniphilus sp. KCTC 25270]MCD1147519.1 glycine betaine/L-proline ABC transporter ATP-binding protein [Peptoniphilus sp. KCTC 25270]
MDKTVKISCREVTKIFGKKEKTASKLLKEGKNKDEIFKKTGSTVGVNQASFDIYEGEVFVVMGLSGSGKSTLIRLMNRLIEPTAGDILVNGESVVKADKKKLLEMRRNAFSMVFQSFALFPHKTILENTEFGLELKKIPKEERTKKAEQALDNSGLLAYKDQYPSQLSGGMQQRVGLARALANNPEILLMDEAFSALDPLIRKDMQDELLTLQEKMKKTIVFITHDLDEALRIGDRIAIMKDGVVVQVGTGEEILTNPANDYVEQFVRDVDRTKILDLSYVMSETDVAYKTSHEEHNLESALETMERKNYSNILVVNERGKALGYIDYEEVQEFLDQGGDKEAYEEILRTDLPRTQKDATVDTVYTLLKDSTTPVVVEDEKGRMEGIVTRKGIIEMLDDEGGAENEFNA